MLFAFGVGVGGGSAEGKALGLEKDYSWVRKCKKKKKNNPKVLLDLFTKSLWLWCLGLNLCKPKFE